MLKPSLTREIEAQDSQRAVEQQTPEMLGDSIELTGRTVSRGHTAGRVDADPVSSNLDANRGMLLSPSRRMLYREEAIANIGSRIRSQEAPAELKETSRKPQMSVLKIDQYLNH